MPEETSKLDWLPILTELGEEIVASIIEKSPDTADAILKARQEFMFAEDEAAALRRKGHEND